MLRVWRCRNWITWVAIPQVRRDDQLNVLSAPSLRLIPNDYCNEINPIPDVDEIRMEPDDCVCHNLCTKRNSRN